MGLNQEPLLHSVLILEDDQNLAAALKDFFQAEGWEVETAATAGEARSRLAESVFDLVLADYLLPDADGLSVFDEIQQRSPLTKVMVMTGVQDMEGAAQALRRGAADLLPKPFKLNDLEQRIEQLMERKRQELEEETEPSADGSRFQMVGRSAAIRKVFRLIDLVADKNATVLITGESGTGKELVARAIHANSPRRAEPFVAINCGAIPENLLEDELFGHVRGAYTDARQGRAGKFEQAHKGTLFLDEIGTMPAALQVKLLRVLEEREFERLGSNHKVQVDVRILAATNCELREKVQEGLFREDLFYRLNVVPIQLPPLRERKEDLPLLVAHFLEGFCRQYKLPKKNLEPAALKLLLRHSWPGNIRELRNTLELATLLSDEREVLTCSDFPALQENNGESESVDLHNLLQLPEEGIDLNQVVSEVEKNLICQSLQRTGGNKGKAARLLYLKRTTLVEKLRRMNLLNEFS